MPVLESLSSSSSSGGGGDCECVHDVDSSYREEGSDSAVAANAESSILMITNAGPGDLRLDAIVVQGNMDAVITVYMAGAKVATGRISIASPMAEFLYPRPQLIGVTDTVDVRVEHFQTGDLGEFGASIMGHRI